ACKSLPSDREVLSSRYAIASRLEDACDVAGTDDVTAAMLFADVVTAMLEFICRSRTGRIPRRKELIATVATIDPESARLADDFFRATDPKSRLDRALALADRS